MARTTRALDKKTVNILRAFPHLNNTQRVALLKVADRKIIKGICECALNLLAGNIDINSTIKRKLYKHRAFLRNLACRKKPSWKHKKKILVQKGAGIIPLLLEPIIGALIAKLF